MQSGPSVQQEERPPSDREGTAESTRQHLVHTDLAKVDQHEQPAGQPCLAGGKPGKQVSEPRGLPTEGRAAGSSTELGLVSQPHPEDGGASASQQQKKQGPAHAVQAPQQSR
jgi:hypothetical protein